MNDGIIKLKLNACISCSRNDCKYTWEKPHVYRVIILKQMADHIEMTPGFKPFTIISCTPKIFTCASKISAVGLKIYIW